MILIDRLNAAVGDTPHRVRATKQPAASRSSGLAAMAGLSLSELKFKLEARGVST